MLIGNAQYTVVPLQSVNILIKTMLCVLCCGAGRVTVKLALSDPSLSHLM